CRLPLRHRDLEPPGDLAVDDRLPVLRARPSPRAAAVRRSEVLRAREAPTARRALPVWLSPSRGPAGYCARDDLPDRASVDESHAASAQPAPPAVGWRAVLARLSCRHARGQIVRYWTPGRNRFHSARVRLRFATAHARAAQAAGSTLQMIAVPE